MLFFEKINQNAKSLVRLRKKEETQIKLEMKEDVIADTTKIQRIIGDYHE